MIQATAPITCTHQFRFKLLFNTFRHHLHQSETIVNSSNAAVADFSVIEIVN